MIKFYYQIKKEIDPIPNEKTKYFFKTIKYKKNRRIR